MREDRGMRRARGCGAVVVLAFVLIFAGAGGDTAAASRALVSPPNCGVTVECASFSLLWDVPAPGLDPGSGTVTSSPGGIDCTVTLGNESGSCEHTFEWTVAQNAPDLNSRSRQQQETLLVPRSALRAIMASAAFP
jgi:hypothetical protein